MPKFISDEDMTKLEGPKKGFISDEEMEKLEQAPEPSIGQRAKEMFESSVIDQLPALGAAGGGMVGGLGGMGIGTVPGALAGAGIGGYTGKALQNAYNTYVRPELAPKTTTEYLTQPVRSGVEGAALEGVGMGAGRAIGAAARSLNPVKEFIAKKLGGAAESLAERATGATGAQAAKFRDGTGRELLDRGIVKFGSSPTGIAKNARAAMDAAEASKSDIIENQLKGTKVDRNTIYNTVRKRIQELSGDESQLALARNLESKLDDIVGVADQTATEVPLAQSEKIRRGFDQSAKWDSASDAPTREANKILANAYREAGEDAATASNPSLGSQFKSAKDTQHLLIPVEEAAEKRALQLQQSPLGGLLDNAAAGAGAVLGGVPGAIAGLGVKSVRPRLASVGAVSADKVAKLLASNPGALGKFGSTLEKSAARGPKAFQTTLRILSHNPEFQEAIKVMDAAAVEEK